MKELRPAKSIGGQIRVPGDKSIAHRVALLSIVAKQPLIVHNFPDNEDCARSLALAQACGVTAAADGTALTLTPPPPTDGRRQLAIDCGNSGTTTRLGAGLLAGLSVDATLSGDASLSTRPMKRIVQPLSEMGAQCVDTNGTLPLIVHGRKLLPITYRMPIASAQVKSSLLLAGLASGCSVVIQEDVLTRDHTELLIAAIGTGISITESKQLLVEDPHDPRKKRQQMSHPFRREVQLASSSGIIGGTIDIPGDFSTAAFFFALAAIAEREITVTQVGLNPTRTAFLDYLKGAGATISIADRTTISGEARGTVTVSGSPLKGRKIQGELTAALIDEIPIVGVVAALSEGTTIIRDAEELRVKETDRLSAIAENLRRMGCRVGLLDDGLAIEGGSQLHGADVITFGDHRIAMAFSIAAMIAVGPTTIDDSSCVAVSCPAFYELLAKVAR